ncbi:hypothetical protein P7K49_008697, partial [Saguinus oedipus]
AGMCLLTNERRAPARTARPPLRLRRPAAARCQVAGEGAAARGAGGRREARAAGLRPSERREGAGSGHFSDSLYLPGKEGRKERRKEARKEGTAPSPCGCTGRRAALAAAGWTRARWGWGC